MGEGGRQAPGAHQRQARRPPGTRGYVRGRTQASAYYHAPACCLTTLPLARSSGAAAIVRAHADFVVPTSRESLASRAATPHRAARDAGNPNVRPAFRLTHGEPSFPGPAHWPTSGMPNSVSPVYYTRDCNHQHSRLLICIIHTPRIVLPRGAWQADPPAFHMPVLEEGMPYKAQAYCCIK